MTGNVDPSIEKLRSKFTAAVQRRDAGRAEVEAANEEIGKLFAQAIEEEARIVSDLAKEADVSRKTAYAMAKDQQGTKQRRVR